MPHFGTRSKQNLQGIHPLLVAIANRVVAVFDIAVTSGVRTALEQQELYAIGRTKELDRSPVTSIDGVKQKSNHQVKEDGYGYAIDCDPYPIDYSNDILVRGRYYTMYGVFLLAAEQICLNTPYTIRWGGDWDGDHSFKDQSFHDLPHIELIKK